MKKFKLVVREKILNPNKTEHDDNGLRALKGIYESPYHEFDDSFSEEEIYNFLKEKYYSNYEHLNWERITLEQN